MKRLLLILTAFCAVLTASAQEKIGEEKLARNDSTHLAIFSQMPNVVIHQSATISKMVARKAWGTKAKTREVTGWSVKVFDIRGGEDAKQEAYRILQMVERKHLQVPACVERNVASQSWVVRVGNFRTEDEAVALRDQLAKMFPTLEAEGYLNLIRPKVAIISNK